MAGLSVLASAPAPDGGPLLSLAITLDTFMSLLLYTLLDPMTSSHYASGLFVRSATSASAP